MVTQRTAVPGPRRYGSPASRAQRHQRLGGTVHMYIKLSRITARAVIGPLAWVGLLSCSSSHKASYDTASGAATSSSSVTPSTPSPGPSTAESAGSSGSADTKVAAGVRTTGDSNTSGSARDTSVAPPPASSPAAASPAGANEHASRSAHRHADKATGPGAHTLKREGTPCVPLANNALARTDLSSSPSSVNPCGAGSMTLPTMAPPSLAKPR